MSGGERKLTNRYENLKSDGRLRTELETWNRNPESIDIIRWYELKDYLNSINFNKNNLMDDEDPMWEKKYPAFIVNKCLSGFVDTIMFSNEINQYRSLDNKLQYDFYLNSIREEEEILSLAKKG